MKRLLTDEQDAYLRSIAYGRSCQECTDMINHKFSTTYTKAQIKNYKSNWHITSGKKAWDFTHSKPRYADPDEIRKFIFDNHKGTSFKDMSKMIKDKFDYDMPATRVKSFYARNHLKNGIDSRFKKGQKSYNKGMKQSEYMSRDAIERCSATRFKPGSVPKNTMPIGTVVKDRDGYIVVKIDNVKKPKNKQVNWIHLHKLLYKFYYGDIPNGYCVFFKNGDINDYSKENLGLISRKELSVMNKKSRINANAEITESYLALTKLEIKAKEILDGSKTGNN